MIISGLVLLPGIERRIRNIFNNVKTDEAIINVYVLNKNYSENLDSYKHSKFITQKRSDQDNQKYAVEMLAEMLEVNVLSTVEKDDIVSAVEALYSGEGELLIMNEAYESMIEEMEGFSNFMEDTKVVVSISKEIEIEEPVIDEKPKEITEKAFTIYVAGCDTRSGRLSIYGRTDVDILVTVNPVTKQIMITGIPRDSYIPNPALSNENDKLTHLGNDGIFNTMKGVSNYFDISIEYYGEVIFDTFKYIVDALGGIDIYNPYYFRSGNVEFPEGNIHLYGNNALIYCRERYSLPNGDYGRSEHQTIVLKGIIQKLMSPEIITNYNAVLNALDGQFLTNMEVDDVYKLIAMQLNDNADWDIISYHLGGEGAMQGTASMGWDWKLYTVNLFDSQVKFIKGETDKMYNNEKIVQGTLPDNDDTTFIPN